MQRLATLVALGALCFASQALASDTHVVGAGQTLGKIAERYHVSVAALCEANGIQRREPIKPGQKLVIPQAGDKDAGDDPPAAKQDDAGDASDPTPSPAHAKDDGAHASKDVPEDTELPGGLHRVDPPGVSPAYYYEPTGKGRHAMRPVIVYLHGRGGHPEKDCQRWAPVARQLGWLICPSGPSEYGDGRAWDNNWPSAHSATMAAIQVLRKKYGRRVQLYGNTLIGFSEGAYAAMNVGVREPHVFNRWLILAANSTYWGGPGIEALQTAKERVRRVFLITGEHDGVIDGTHQVEDWLNRAGVSTRVVTPDDMGHELALDRKPELYHQALAWLDKGEPKRKKSRAELHADHGAHAERVARK